MIMTTETAEINIIMNRKFFVASCVFTEEYPELSRKIQAYVKSVFALPIIRCCVANYKVEEFEKRMPDWYRDEWSRIEHYPDLRGEKITVQDCWRQKENRAEQNAVREILRRKDFCMALKVYFKSILQRKNSE